MPKPKSRAEIQREYRSRRDADPTRRERYLQNECGKYRHDLLSGKRKHVADMNEREARKERREWKKRQRRSRLVHKARTNMCTPPPTPSTDTGGHQSRQKETGRKCVRRERAAGYRRIAALEKELEKATRKAERLRRNTREHQSRPCLAI